MANWDSYTQKSTPKDNDTLMIKDTDGGANKRTPFSGVWNWIVKKLASAVISQLETTNKSIIPAINELNSKSLGLSVNDSFAGKTIMEYITPRPKNGIAVVRTWTPPSDAPLQSNACWVFFVIRFLDSNNYVYTKILSLASDVEGDTANAWLGSVSSADTIKWKAL